MHFDVDDATLFLTLSGSHAYGMARDTSDVDIRGVCLRPVGIRNSLYKTFEQYQTTQQTETWGRNSTRALNRLVVHPTAAISYVNNPELDLVIYSLAKFLKLATNANPSVMELLFVDEEDVLFSTSLWDRVREKRDLFVTKKCKHTFTGYAHSQLRRIKSHRAWLLNTPKEPTRSEFGLPDQSVLPADVRNLVDEAVKKVLRDWMMEDDIELTGAVQDVFRDRVRTFYSTLAERPLEDGDLYEMAALSTGVTKDVLHVIKAERRYRSARKHWEQYTRWKRERNEARAEMEAKFGYDVKHGSHLIRLMRMGLEILRDGKVIVRRPDAQELLDIRRGALSYDELIEQAESLEAQINSVYKDSPLPKAPDMGAIDDLYQECLFRS